RLGRRGARPRLRSRRRDPRRQPGGGERGDADAAGANVSARTRSVIGAVAWRTLHRMYTNPALLLPSLIFPLFFFTAFAGGLSAISKVPGFDFSSGYTAFQFVFVLLQASAFGGVFTGCGIACDFESGFARRLMFAGS